MTDQTNPALAALRQHGQAGGALFRVPEQYRVRAGRFATSERDGNNGLFLLGGGRGQLRVIASDGVGWEHVSVSRSHQIPSWLEMAAVKQLFWGPDAVVVEYHVAAKDHVNVAANCLHLWRPIGLEMPCPPSILVGPLR